MKDLQKAKEILINGGHTCVLCSGERICTSDLRGVRPLLQWLDSGEDFSGFHAADKVVGRATAMLYCLLGVKGVHAGVMSEGAVQVLENHGIYAEYDRKADYIQNRAGTGQCPMEAAVAGMNDPQEGLQAVRQTLERLK